MALCVWMYVLDICIYISTHAHTRRHTHMHARTHAHTHTCPLEIKSAICVRIFDESICVSSLINTLGRKYKASCSPSIYGWIVEQAGSLGNQIWKKKTLNSNKLYSVEKLTLCRILLIAEGLGKCIYSNSILLYSNHYCTLWKKVQMILWKTRINIIIIIISRW